MVRVTSKTAEQAFAVAREHAINRHGGCGYTGTIAEKTDFVFIGTSGTVGGALDSAKRLINNRDPRIDDKWGPAGCIRVAGTDTFLFFGWASE
jgi:hypothetical protein